MRRFRAAVWLAVVVAVGVGTSVASAVAPAYVHPRVREELAEKGAARVIVSLWDESLPQARAKDWPDRIPAVQELTRRALAAAPKFQVYRTYQIFPFLAGSADEEALAQLAACPIVESIYPDREVRATLAQSGPLIGQPAAEAQGGTGAGIGIAVLDTGIDYTHPDFGAPGPYPNAKVRGGYDFVNNDSNPWDDYGHGTHVASIAAGTGTTYRGIAPGAHLLALKVLDADGGGTMSAVIAAVEWCIQHKTEFNIRVMNMSFGDGGQWTDPHDCDDLPESESIRDAVSAGILAAISAGNEAYSYGISFPACISAATSVGATYDETRSGGTVDTTTDYSNRGELVDLLAPGSFITAAKLGGDYIEYEGTSMAAPHVAGAAAVLAQKGLNTPADIQRRLQLTGKQIVDPYTNIQTPRIDLAKALAGAPTTGPDLVITEVTVSATTVCYGDQVTVTLTLKNQGTSSSGACKAVVGLSENSIPSPQDLALAEISVPIVAANTTWSSGSVSAAIPEIPRGIYTLIGFADSSYAVSEKDETNNGLVGATVRVGDTAAVVANTIPEFMLRGQTYPISVTIMNDGTSTWHAVEGFVLAPTSPDNTTRWGITSVPLPDGTSVHPGGTVTFDFNVTAPAQPGWYPCHWQMKRGSTGFFGEVATGANRVYVVDDTLYGQNYPAIDGDRVAYEDYSRMTTWYAISTKNLNTGAVFTIPDNLLPQYAWDFWADNWYPDISGSRVTWMVDNVSAYLPEYGFEFWFFQIAAFDLNSRYDRPFQVTYQYADAFFPAIDGDRIVFEDYTNDPDRIAFSGWDDPDIVIYDLTDGRLYPLCIRPGAQFAPRISGDLVVWEDWRDGQADIFLYDLAVDTDGDGLPNWKDPDRPNPDPAERRLTNTSYHELEPDISGRRVVWLDLRRDGGSFSVIDIYAMDLDTLAQTAIATDPPTVRVQARVDGTQIVWYDYRFGVPDVFWTDLALGAPMPQPIAGSAGWEVIPNISGRRLVYGEWRADYGVWNVVLQDLFTHGSVGVHTFTDVTNDYWAWSYVEAVAAHGVVKGYEDGTYQPELLASRDQMATYLARAIAGGDGSVPPGPATPTFPDVPTDYWAYKYIEFCANPAQDIAHGFEDGTYRPTQVVDRAGMAVFVARAVAGGDSFFDTYVPPVTPSFPDVTSTNQWQWCYKYVEYIKSQGVTSGYPDGLYHPEVDCTRGQMAVYVSRAFGYLP